MTTLASETHTARIFLSGPIEVAKQTLRAECMREGLCVTIDPTTFIYTGGEEAGYVVTLRQYPRFPIPSVEIDERAFLLAEMLLNATYQHSAMIVTPTKTTWISKRQG